jgi:hypothetical protein
MIFNSGIKFDGRWDVRSGFATHQILVVSISNRSRMGGTPRSVSGSTVSARNIKPCLCEVCKQNFHPTEKEYRQMVAEYGGEQLYKKTACRRIRAA